MKRILAAALVLPLLLSGGELVFLVTADLHGAFRNLAALAPVLRPEKEAIRLDLGDLFQGDFDADRLDGLPMMEALNRLPCHFFVPGNHDFELPHSAFRRFAGAFQGTLLGGGWRVGPVRGKPWVLIRRGPFRCALIGLTDPRMSFRAPALAGAEFLPPEQVLQRIMPEIRRVRPDAVVLAWHSGSFFRGGTLAGLLKKFPEIDLVFGAHTHEEIPGKRIGRAFLLQPGSHGKAAGRAVLTFDDATGRLLAIRTSLLRPDLRKPDPGILALFPPRGETGPVLHASSGEDFLIRGAAALQKCARTAMGLFSCRSPRGGSFTERELFALLPFRNFVAAARVTPGELHALRQELRGVPHRFCGRESGSGETDLALSDHLLCSSRALRECVREKRFRLLPVTEREALLASEEDRGPATPGSVFHAADGDR